MMVSRNDVIICCVVVGGLIGFAFALYDYNSERKDMIGDTRGSSYGAYVYYDYDWIKEGDSKMREKMEKCFELGGEFTIREGNYRIAGTECTIKEDGVK